MCGAMRQPQKYKSFSSRHGRAPLMPNILPCPQISKNSILLGLQFSSIQFNLHSTFHTNANSMCFTDDKRINAVQTKKNNDDLRDKYTKYRHIYAVT